jgi:hypothetical protein
LKANPWILPQHIHFLSFGSPAVEILAVIGITYRDDIGSAIGMATYSHHHLSVDEVLYLIIVKFSEHLNYLPNKLQ